MATLRSGPSSYLIIALIAATIGLVDVRILPYLQASGMSSNGFIEVAIYMVAGILGLRLASENGFPIWWRKWPELRQRGHLFLIGALSLFIVALTTSLYFLTLPAGLPSWADALTPELAILLPIRAALGEEILFRFFIFAAIVWLGNKLGVERGVLLIAGVIFSSIAFALIHPGFYIPFLEGLALALIYFESGLVPVMVVHFLADAIPFLILSLR